MQGVKKSAVINKIRDYYPPTFIVDVKVVLPIC
jgi:hypothetical protein